MSNQVLSRLNFQAVLDGIDDGIFISDASGYIIMVNRSVEKTGNKKSGELVGKNKTPVYNIILIGAVIGAIVFFAD